MMYWAATGLKVKGQPTTTQVFRKWGPKSTFPAYRLITAGVTAENGTILKHPSHLGPTLTIERLLLSKGIITSVHPQEAARL